MNSNYMKMKMKTEMKMKKRSSSSSSSSSSSCSCYDCFNCFNTFISLIKSLDMDKIYDLGDGVVKELICTEGRIKSTFETLINEALMKEEFELDDEREEVEEILDYLFELGILKKKHINKALDDIESIKKFDKHSDVNNIKRYFTCKNKYVKK